MNLKKLDKIFSFYIRLRDVDSSGYGQCCTSGQRLHYKDGHCGHFMSRRHLSTRWDEKNCALQSVADNIFNQGNQYQFARFIDKKYGPGTADKLLVKSRQTSKISQFEIDTFTEFYKQQVEILRKQKGL